MNRLSGLFVISALTLAGVASVGTPPAQAQTFTVIHAFAGGDDGYQPYAGLTLDGAGNLYGTTTEGLTGTVFQLQSTDDNRILNTLNGFGLNPHDARFPLGRVVFGPDGTLYGTTFYGGSGHCPGGCGTVYNLRPPVTGCKTVVCRWTETVLYSFTGGPDGSGPFYVDPVFDQAGNLYGTTEYGGSNGYGVVFKLAPSGGGWTESVIHNFAGEDGIFPASGVIFDRVGNLYGTSGGGLSGQGNVYQLAPSGSGWTATNLHSFQNGTDGEFPVAGLIVDQSGNLYGTTSSGGSGGGGTVFELSSSDGSWMFAVLYGLSGGYIQGPRGSLAMDVAGNLYGTTYAEGIYYSGTLFKLTRSQGGWAYTRLHDFTGSSDGANPLGGPALDANGNVYGTTEYGGSFAGENCGGIGCGVVWEITP